MYTLELTLEELNTLVDLLECSVSDIHTEILHTDDHCMRQILKDRKHTLLKLVETLRALQASGVRKD